VAYSARSRSKNCRQERTGTFEPRYPVQQITDERDLDEAGSCKQHEKRGCEALSQNSIAAASAEAESQREVAAQKVCSLGFRRVAIPPNFSGGI